MNQKILVLGAQGMLGQELVNAYRGGENVDVVGWDFEDIDVTNYDDLRKKITDLNPDVVYNAIAYNAVDACEEDDSEYAKALDLNSVYPEQLRRICVELGAVMVHYSTDYVFDGRQPVMRQVPAGGCCGGGCCGKKGGAPDQTTDIQYEEAAHPAPLQRYGQTKFAGEQAVAAVEGEPPYYIIRLSKLFGKPAASAAGKKSFFDVMLAKGREAQESGDKLMAVDGEVSKFTYAPDLANESKAIVDEGSPSGIYHVANGGAVTWYEGVQALYKIAQITAHVDPVPPETFPRPAKRPSISTLAVTKRASLRHYEEALKEYVEAMQKD